jgi:hypothetical protein
MTSFPACRASCYKHGASELLVMTVMPLTDMQVVFSPSVSLYNITLYFVPNVSTPPYRGGLISRNAHLRLLLSDVWSAMTPS